MPWVVVGINLARSQRFLCRFYRRILGQLNPTLAQIPTTRGGMTLRAGKELVEFLRILRALREGRWKSPIPKENPLLI